MDISYFTLVQLNGKLNIILHVSQFIFPEQLWIWHFFSMLHAMLQYIVNVSLLFC